MSYPTTNTPIATYAGTALMGDIDHAGWHGLTNTDLDGVKTTLGTTAGTSVLKNLTAGDFVPTQATGAEVNTGTATLKYVSPKAIAGSTIAKVGAAGSDITTGTDTVKFVTAKAMADAGVNVVSGTFSLKANCIINAGFTINQRAYVSNATLTAGIYGHDRWKAGSGGGDYTFTQLASSTVITIKANKTLIQVIENVNVIGGTYTLSWTGTAQARYAVDSATPGGSYAASPIAITSQTAGTVMSVEFNAGTLSNVVLNSGATALPFMPKSYNQEFQDCMRYYIRFKCDTGFAPFGAGYALNTTIGEFIMSFPVSMRDSPALSQAGNFGIIVGGGSVVAVTTAPALSGTSPASAKNVMVQASVASGLTQGDGCLLISNSDANAYIGFDAEL